MGALKRDIAVAGCGPGGLAAALLLHRAGHRVTLFEQFETPRPVGSGLMLQASGLAVLDHLGLGSEIRTLGAPIERLFGRSVRTGRTVLDVRFAALGSAFSGLAIHRGALFHSLLDAARHEGLTLETGRPIAGSTLVPGGRALCFADGRTAGPFDLVVNALGTRSPLGPPMRGFLRYGALWATLDWPDGNANPFDPAALEQRYRRASRMVGVMPVGLIPGQQGKKLTFFWSLRAADHSRWQADGLDPWKEAVAALWPETHMLLDQINDPEQITFARYAHRTLASPVDEALVHLGDAWHSTSPQLGQGANMALLDAAALGSAFSRSASISDALAHYRRLRQGHIRLYQSMSWLFTPVYQSDGRLLPLLRDYLVPPLASVPPLPRLLATIVSGLLGRPLRKLDFSAVAPR